MGVRKTEEADEQKRYPIYIEVGMIAALLLLIAAFRFDILPNEKTEFKMQEQETVELEEVKQTKQKLKPPPPPRPPVPIEKPNNEVLENQELDFDATLDLEETLEPTQQTDMPQEEEEETDEVVPFSVIEDKPKIKGGMQAIYDKIDYPAFARRAGIQGTVFLQFTVDKQGQVTEPKIMRSPHDALGKEALRALKQVEFTPGMQRKQPVKVRMSLPIKFQLEN